MRILLLLLSENTGNNIEEYYVIDMLFKIDQNKEKA